MDPLRLEHRCVLVIASAPCSAHSAEWNQVEAPCSGCCVQAPSGEAAADGHWPRIVFCCSPHPSFLSFEAMAPPRTRPLSSANPVSLCSRRRLRSSAECISSIGDAPAPISTAAARATRTRQRPDVSSLAPALSARGAAARCTPPRPTSALLRGRRRRWPSIDLMTQNSPHQPANPACASPAI